MIGGQTIRWLYEVDENGKPLGGGPSAFKCLIDTCGAVTRTLSGMRTHQRIVHRLKEQEEMFEEEKQYAIPSDSR